MSAVQRSDGKRRVSLHYHAVLRSIIPLLTIPGVGKYQRGAAEQRQDKHMAVKKRPAIRSDKAINESGERRGKQKKREIMTRTLAWVRRNTLTKPNRHDRVNGCFSLLNCGGGAAGPSGAPGDWLDVLSYPPCHTPFLHSASPLRCCDALTLVATRCPGWK